MKRWPAYLALAFAVLLSPFADARSPRLRNDEDSYLLVGVAPNAAAAYSLRPLAPAYERTLPLLRARRSSDNAERDVYYYELTNGSLISWTGAANAFVVNWRDQSGNARNATQATAGNQPQIVAGGALVTDGIDFDGTNDGFVITGFAPLSLTYYTAAVVAWDVVPTGQRTIFDSSKTTTGGFGFAAGVSAFRLTPFAYYESTTARVITGATNLTTSRTVLAALFKTGASACYVNGVEDGTNTVTWSTAGTNNLTFATIGYDQETGGRYINGKLGELLVYESDESSRRILTESNILQAWGVTP